MFCGARGMLDCSDQLSEEVLGEKSEHPMGSQERVGRCLKGYNFPVFDAPYFGPIFMTDLLRFDKKLYIILLQMPQYTSIFYEVCNFAQQTRIDWKETFEEL